jgi:hypothetical protein
MNARRVIAAVVSTVALLAVNVGMADSASARGSAWGFAGQDTVTTKATNGSAWG